MTQLDAPQLAADTDTQLWDTIVIGAGPAGLSAALMLTRGRRRVLVLDHGVPRNRFTDHMHGVLGHEGLAPGEQSCVASDGPRWRPTRGSSTTPR